MIQIATKKNANRILALLRSVSAGSLSFAGLADSGAQGLRSLAWGWMTLLRSVSASSLSFAGLADSGPALAGHAAAWILAPHSGRSVR